MIEDSIASGILLLEAEAEIDRLNKQLNKQLNTNMKQDTNCSINAAIAEACGWRKEDGVYMWTANGIDCTYPELWDWCNDLNAMHEAEKVIKDKELLFEYGMHISNSHNYEYLLRATARERAEAFLRTLGKWEEAVVKESFTTGEAE